MNYYSITYDLRGNPIIIRSDGATIPQDLGNADFRAFLTWNAQQAVPLDYTTPTAPSKFPRNIKDIILGSDGLNSLSGSLTGPQKVAVWSNFALSGLYFSGIGNQAALMQVASMAQDGIITSGAINTKFWAIAAFMQDWPNYLVNPTFSPVVSGVNIPGNK